MGSRKTNENVVSSRPATRAVIGLTMRQFKMTEIATAVSGMRNTPSVAGT